MNQRRNPHAQIGRAAVDQPTVKPVKPVQLVKKTQTVQPVQPLSARHLFLKNISEKEKQLLIQRVQYAKFKNPNAKVTVTITPIEEIIDTLFQPLPATFNPRIYEVPRYYTDYLPEHRTMSMFYDTE